MINRKIISIFELTLIVMSSFAFAYFVSTDLPDVFEKQNSVIQYLTKPIIPVVSASDYVPSGCCKETVSGATCQDVLLVDKALCKTDLIGTSCNVVSECQKGCCYDADSGICSLNAPKESCTTFGGIWDISATCSIQQCQVGCCILGDGAAMTTTRECTKLSNEYEVNKIFKQLDSRGSCDAYADLRDEGACLTESNDYSGLKNCVFTTKGNCNRANQEFKKGYLCTSKELNTTCEKTTKTSCVSGDDRVYFIDSCGNKANVYDSFKGKNQTYWEKVISPKDSCNGVAEFCGNCDYSTGSICTKYFTGKNLIKPEMGDYVCKNLDCANGRKHGESWCISDSDNSKDLSQSVGNRNYVATCFEGEIKLEGCADFNQEICIENIDASTKKNDAMCITNDWRSCIYANDATSYSAVKTRCDALPQCVMFNDIPGNEKYKNLPGFKENTINTEQGRAGQVGANMNQVVTYCVPRFTPGYQFWTPTALSGSTNGKVASTQGYGGSKSETNSLCGLGSFTCVSHIKTVSSIAGGSTSTDWENPECNMQAVSQSKQKVTLMMDALNDRCRSLGSCGLQYNTQGELGRSGFTVNRIYIDKKGKSTSGYTTEGYNLSSNYLSNLKKEQSGNKIGTVDDLLKLSDWKGGASMLTQFGSEYSSSGSMIANAFSGSAPVASGDNTAAIVGGVGALAGLGALATAPAAGSTTAAILASDTAASTTGTVSGSSAGGSATLSAALTVVAIAAIAFTVGSFIGQMMSKGQSPGQAKITTALWAGGMTFAVTGTIAVLSFFPDTLGAILPMCLGPQAVVCGIVAGLIAVAAIIYATFTKGIDHEYYVTEFKCEAWQPPLVGKCEECNKDVRSCTEFKCRSIGNNCHYFVENGEPGYCATLEDIWNAKIEPWKEVLTEQNNYTNVSSFGFRIVNLKNTDKAVNAWEPIKFGITTDKESICKADLNHSLTFEQMRFVMKSELDYKTGKVDGKHHTITLSPHTIIRDNNENIETTMPMEEGDNEYYIICQNYAGLVNDAPFAVQVKQKEGPDLTPPLITKYSPDNNAYLANNATGLDLYVYLNEPAECIYSFDSNKINFETNTQNKTDIISITSGEEQEVTIGAYEMPSTPEPLEGSAPMTCITDPNMGYYGEWMCAIFLNNYSSNQKIYIKCKDQPELIESAKIKRNVIQTEYNAQICPTGLEISSIEPSGKIEINTSATVTLKVTTEGCINGGDANCNFRLPYYGDIYSLMLNTGNKTHTQPFTSLGQGTRDVDVTCEDIAGNVATAHTNFTVFVDDIAPQITRAYSDADRIVLNTDENAECLYTINETIGCDFGFEKTSGVYGLSHPLPVDKKSKDKYFVKCRDEKGNMPLNECSIELKLTDIQQ